LGKNVSHNGKAYPSDFKITQFRTVTRFGKTIKLFLIDGEPNGRLTCELSNWTGKAYKIPRVKIKDCSDRSDLSNPGVYLRNCLEAVGTTSEPERLLERGRGFDKQG